MLETDSRTRYFLKLESFQCQQVLVEIIPLCLYNLNLKIIIKEFEHGELQGEAPRRG